ncbi:hypothetical protein Dimus_002640 [Dionaea muscipula]
MRDDGDEPSELLKASSSQSEQSPAPEPSVTAEPQIPDQCDSASLVNRTLIPSQDAAMDTTMTRKGGVNLMAGESPVALVDGETVREEVASVFEDELADKDGFPDAVSEELPLAEDGYFSTGEGEGAGQALVKNGGESEIVKDKELIVDGEVEIAQENDEKSEIVKEDESPVAGENQDKSEVEDLEEKDADHQDVKIEEETEVPELGIGPTEEAPGEMEAKKEEVTEEITEPCRLPEMTDENGPRVVNEVDMKQADEPNRDHGALIVGSGNLQGGVSMCKDTLNGVELPRGEMGEEESSCKRIGGEECSQEEMDDYSLGLDDAAGSLFVGDDTEMGEDALPAEEINDFRINDNIESQEEDVPALIDDTSGSPSAVHKDKDPAAEEEGQETDDFPPIVSQNGIAGEDEVAVGSTEMEMEGVIEAEGSKSGSGGKRKVGRIAKVPAKTPKILVGEDVCFICLDGGDLVLCDRRGCPKAYHPSCVDRDEAFFQAKGRWNCGWHLCSKCEKNAYYMCCTCAFSLCKGCIKDAVIFSLRGNKGLCETCMKIVMLIESTEQGKDEMVAFDDKSRWEYLFKDYWMEQKEKLSFTAKEIMQAKNPWKGFNVDNEQEMPAWKVEVVNEVGNALDSSVGNVDGIDSKRKKIKKRTKSSGKEVDSDTDSSSEKPDGSIMKRKAKRRLKPPLKEADSDSDSDNSTRNLEKTVTRGRKAKKLAKYLANGRSLVNQTAEGGTYSQGDTRWASEELLELVMHMRNGDRSVLSQFDVQEILLEYIKRNKLRDPRRRSQIVCDPMLEKLFGKPRVGHFEMLKLLESHFLIKRDSQVDSNQGGVLDTESHMDVDENAVSLRGRKSRKKGDERALQSNLDDYAAIDMHNINLIYLRRNLMEALMEDSERFREKVVGSFVRIRISGSVQKQDLYRLVQVVGTGKAEEPYKVGKRTTDIMLEILNLDKTELVSIDSISNQEFTEDECKRLRQSIKCGLNSRLTVGVVLGKAKELHIVRVTDWLETEKVRLRHLCDRASDLGRKREYPFLCQYYVFVLYVPLNFPSTLRENVEKLQLLKTPEERQRRLDEIPVVHADPNMDPSYDSDDESEIENKQQEMSMRQRESGSFRRADQFSARKGGYSSNDSSSPTTLPPNRKWDSSRTLSGKAFSSGREDASHHAAGEISTRSSWHHQGAERGVQQSNSWEKQTPISDSTPGRYADAVSEPSHHLSTVVPQVDAKINEADKLWHYRDPTGKTQGPFSMVQLRKWNSSGFFPADLRIWRSTETEDDSILLTSALAGMFQKEPSCVVNAVVSSVVTMIKGSSHVISSTVQSQSVTGSSLTDLSSKGFAASSSVVNSKFSTNVGSSESGSIHDSPSLLPSPTPQSSIGWTRRRNSVSRWSPAVVPNQSSPVTEVGQFTRPSNPSSSSSAQTAVALDDVQNVSAATTTHALASQNTATNPVQGLPNVAQSGSVQNYGWGSGGYAARPGNSQAWGGGAGPQNNPNMMPANQQPAYGYWANNNAPPVNGQSQPSVAGQFQGAGNFPTQNFSAQNQWRAAQVPANVPWGMAGPANRGVAPGWASMPANPNLGWVGAAAAARMVMGPVPGPPTSAASFAAPSGQAVGLPTALPGMQPGNTNAVGWSATGIPNNPGWIAPPTGFPGTWGSEQNRGGGGGGGAAFGNSKAQELCRFHEKGKCRKGASCEYLHT